MTLEEALERREESRRLRYIDSEAIERLCELLPGEDPRHPFHGPFMLGKRIAERMNQAALAAISNA